MEEFQENIDKILLDRIHRIQVKALNKYDKSIIIPNKYNDFMIKMNKYAKLVVDNPIDKYIETMNKSGSLSDAPLCP